MTASKTLAKLIRISIEKDARGVFVARSADLKGLVAVSSDLAKLQDTLIPRAISDLYLACGQKVVVSRAEPVEDASSHDGFPWVAMPAEIAMRQLEDHSI